MALEMDGIMYFYVEDKKGKFVGFITGNTEKEARLKLKEINTEYKMKTLIYDSVRRGQQILRRENIKKQKLKIPKNIIKGLKK
jgi:predicted nucleotide-binding protein